MDTTDNVTDRGRFGPTMIHWAVLMCAVALLSATIIPIHHSLLVRAYEAEMLKGMSFIKIAQDRYYAENGRYAGTNAALPVTEDVGLDLPEDGYPSLKYLRFKDLIMSVSYPEADRYRLSWLLPESTCRFGFTLDVTRLEMDQDGNIY